MKREIASTIQTILGYFMKKNIFLLCLLCSCFSISAQLPPQFLQNPAISWAAEFEMDVLLTPEPDSFQTQVVQPLKFVMHPDSFTTQWGVHTWQGLQQQLFHALRAQKLQHYSDSALSKPAYLAEWRWKWSTSSFVKNSRVDGSGIHYPVPATCSHLRVRQIIYYDSVKVNWNLYTLAVGFGLEYRWNGTEYQTPQTPEYWIPVHAPLSPFEKPAVTWAMRFKTTPKTHLKISKLNVLKAMNEPLQHFVEKARVDSKLPLWRNNKQSLLSESERKSLNNLTIVDTIPYYNPITYEQKYRVVKNRFLVAEIQQLQLVQDWYWDQELGQLQIQLKEVAPIWIGSGTENHPLYYRKTDE
jgi:hypothetical protein